MATYRYSEWDGSQNVAELSGEELIEALSDEVMAHGDLAQALRRLAMYGIQGRFGRRLPGLHDLLQQLRARRQEVLDRYNLASAVDELRGKLDNILKLEREGIQKRREEARHRYQEGQAQGGKGGEELLNAVEKVAARNQAFLDNLPQDLGGAIKALTSYEFMDGQARQQFEELLQMLKQRVMESYFKDISQRLRGLTPEQLQQIKEMVKALNQMLREKQKGGQPDFQNFMKQFAKHFGPQPPSSLEELLQQLQERMAQMQSLLASLPQEARESLEGLMESLLDSQDLRAEFQELAAALAQMYPLRNLRNRYPFQGQESLSLEEAMRLMEQLQGLDQVEKQLERTRFGAPLEDIDLEKLRQLLGEEAARVLEQLRRFTDLLEKAGYLWWKGERLELSPKGMRRIGQKALRDVFAHLQKDRFGKHRIEHRGTGGERADETRRYEFGAPFHLHLEKTLMRAVERGGPGTPLKLKPEDFEVYETEHLSQSSTVLMLDLSWSMPLRGKFFAAKKVALALDSLIRTQFPRDNLYLVGFSDYARQLSKDDLMHIIWNEYVYGTNMHHGFLLSRSLLAKHKTGNRQIIMITDGEPTAHLEGNQAYFEYPPSPRTLQLTLLEAKRCAQEGIVINTFMLDRSYHLMEFIDLLTRVGRGRAFYTTPENLGQYLLVDYLTNKRRRLIS